MKITTRGGDAGKTSLGDGTRVDKDNIRVALVGTIDECQAHVGMARALASKKAFISEKLLLIEKELGKLMGHLTLYEGCECPPLEPLESVIAIAESNSEPFRFLEPGASELAAALHIARTVARRAERTAAPLVRGSEISSDAAKYLNRLSDYFYSLALIDSKS